MLQAWMRPADLAPGDVRSLARDWSDLTLHRIRSADDPLFERAYQTLWSEFGAAGEVETRDVLAARLQWDGRTLRQQCALRYGLMFLTANDAFAAVRDHTAIVRPGHPGAIVHLSHNLVAPAWRRSGLAGWLRALPIQTARHCLEAQSRPPDEPITLVGEMEHPNPASPATMIRLTAYEKAGFLKLDPAVVPYMQPDFRPAHKIDRTGGPKPIPMTLVVRRVGREHETHLPGDEARGLAEALYHMFAVTFRATDMAPLMAGLSSYPTQDVRLLRPTEPTS